MVYAHSGNLTTQVYLIYRLFFNLYYSWQHSLSPMHQIRQVGYQTMALYVPLKHHQ